MNVLITGDLSILTTTFSETFRKERYKIVCVGSHSDELKKKLPYVTCHTISPADEIFQEVVSAYRFDVVIYIATREEQLLQHDSYNTGKVLDGLLHTLEVCKNKHIQKIFYISSTEIYGSQDAETQAAVSESIDPQPASPNGFALKTGEQYCRYYNEQFGLSSTIVRVPFVYSPEEPKTLLHGLIRTLQDKDKLTFPSKETRVCSFLHAADVADFVLRSIDDYFPGLQTVNLSSADPLTFSELAEMLKGHFPGAHFSYPDKDSIATQPAVVSNAKKMYDWIPEHKLREALPGVVEAVRQETTHKISLVQRLQARFPRYSLYLKWVEVLLGAIMMVYLNELSGTLIEFRYVDFRLIYVVMMGLIYGTQVGLVASGLAALSLLFSWVRLDLDWAELVFNVSSWLPFAVYLIAGTLTGYFHDKKENEIQYQTGQNQLVQEKFKFLYQLYQEVVEIKNKFQEQLVGARDSFGRIYHITRQLDTLEEAEVLIKALSVLEDVMGNHNIAIYSINPTNSYARLEVYSSQLRGQITRSLNLADHIELTKSIEQGEIFQNIGLLPNLPAYFAPIRDGSTTVAAIVIWNANFDQFSFYYFNLFKVICGLVQSSINRAALFLDANLEKTYLPYTRILKPEPFKKVIQAKSNMKKAKIGDYILVKVNVEETRNSLDDFIKLYNLVSREIRTEDYLGVLEDGHCYVLFSQADHSNSQQIYLRLEQHGISCQPMHDQFVLSLNSSVPVKMSEELSMVLSLRG
jgi:UDP-glucose 4-epimerase